VSTASAVALEAPYSFMYSFWVIPSVLCASLIRRAASRLHVMHDLPYWLGAVFSAVYSWFLGQCVFSRWKFAPASPVVPRRPFSPIVTSSMWAVFTHFLTRHRWSTVRPSGMSLPESKTHATLWAYSEKFMFSFLRLTPNFPYPSWDRAAVQSQHSPVLSTFFQKLGSHSFKSSTSSGMAVVGISKSYHRSM